VVFADQAAEDPSAFDPGGDLEGVAGLALRRLLLQALVRTMAVVVPGVLGQDVAEMLLAEDQHMVKALAAKRPDESLRERVRPRRPDRRPDHPCAIPGEDAVERRGELAVPVTDQEPEPAGALPRSMSRLRACWAVHVPVG
jgi:hypothetical protein